MRFTLATAALIATATAGYIANPPPLNPTSYPVESTKAPIYVTKTVSHYTTYCPGPTQITTNDKTYTGNSRPPFPCTKQTLTVTVTEATTLTITDCPCTVIETTSAYVPILPTSEPAPYPCKNCTAAPPTYPTGTGAPYQPGAPSYTPGAPAPPSHSAPPEFEGAAAKFGVGLLAFAGVAVAML